MAKHQTGGGAGMDPSRVLALVVAHPDDDAYGLAGTVALHEDDPGFRFVLVHATDGGAGQIDPSYPPVNEPLGRIRRRETDAAWTAHGRPPDRHEWLDYDDGAVAAVPFAELVERIGGILAQERPDVVATFGPDGLTGHPDHIAVGAATDEAFAGLRGDGGRGLQRLLHGGVCRSTWERWNRTRIRHGLQPWAEDRVYDVHPVPDEQIGVEVDVHSVAHRVVAGLLEHRTQRHVVSPGVPPDVDEDARWGRTVATEMLAIAWPPQPAGAARLGDVFEGLD
ncbi:PIG-L family deacetylase [Arthrobacter sp. zg-Y877]|uniref:PIG-L deacetylase family protein n=1 Tax=Arthrobacter sp. zg-Y877 TaxID=3049074 RepID=UPI0025A47D3D|nr:PIG-L family deacetylase [Arthrobacter sp. zg-Y877]MDM7989456.1 PIG-L family deacetylase [Arthrobacter sp. zg-Y877]